MINTHNTQATHKYSSNNNMASETSERASDGLGVQGFLDSKRYEKVRPDYPKEAVKTLMIQLGVLKENGEVYSDKTFNILELGAGTGKFTRVMVDVLKDAKVRIIASDPAKNMCDQFKEVLPEIEIKQFSAENIDAKDQSFDVVIAVDCFHWFSFQESLNEIHRVLIPGGMLGLSWNLLSPGIPWQKTIRDFLVPFYEKNSIIPRKDLAEMVASSKLFLKEGEDSTSFFEEKKCHPEEAYQYMISISVLNAWCSDEEKEEFKALFDKITKEILVETGKQEFTIIFTIPIFWFKKSPKA